jgi:thioredoxin-dependent peroxiredoxin
MVKELVEADQAPDFELPTDGGGRAHLKDLKGKAVVVYFYPKDDTSGCTAEAIAFNGLRAKFAAAGATVIGVSPDSAASHDKFKRKRSTFLIDREGRIAKVWRKVKVPGHADEVLAATKAL